ncbi:MAG: PAS-domain containing protein [Rhodospirillum sp.]|nr:PAS-domain containing protein [Rhodospirillum sp.]MCF8489668.1 PAS-domain containing protein [Rhodospirillum sp.]MCF8501492.1 PAS-domain containing protein [Rhodospirillum sp.]
MATVESEAEFGGGPVVDQSEPLDVQVARQAKIIDALIARLERENELGDTAYSLFQSAIALQGEVWEKTRDLERALDTLGRASSELESAERSRDRMRNSLSDAMMAVEGGFALFSEEGLQVCNDLFKRLLPDVESMIRPGLTFEAYSNALRESAFLVQGGGGSRGLRLDGTLGEGEDVADRRYASFVVALKNDRWFQVSCRRTGYDNIVILQTEITDVVERNRREKDALIDQHASFLQAAFDHMSLGICTFSAEGRLLVTNDRFGHLLGLPLPLLRKGTAFRRIREFVERFEPFNPRGLERWVRESRRGERVRERFRRPDGISIDLQINGLPDNGFIVTAVDVTAETEAEEAGRRMSQMLERRVEERTAELTEANLQLRLRALEQLRTEEALREAKEFAEAAHASKTRFLAAASHDLLQPINAAKLYLSLLRATVAEDGPADMLARLGHSFSMIETLLQSLLEISRLDHSGAEFTVKSVNLRDVMRVVEADMAPQAAQKGIALRVMPTSRWGMSDQGYLTRCLQNLVSNAIQYTDRGRVLVGCRAAGKGIRLEVWDTGVGIPEAEQNQVFIEFARGSGARAGTGMGLGLSIVQRACHHLGHPVTLRSVPGKGSLFAIEIPLAEPGLDLATLGRAEEEEALSDLDLIALVVENDPDVLNATVHCLESWGAGVLATTSTTEALALLEELGTPPDIILADYHLDGDETGVDAIHALRAAAGVEVPAILVTADRSKALRKLGTRQDFTVLGKPVQPSRLRALIDWKTRNRVA